MKSKILFLAMATFCLASCNKEQLKDTDPGTVQGDEEYMLEILETGAEGQTKSSPSTVELNLANLVSASSKSITAQLKKKSGGSWVNVDSGVSYSWSASSADSQKFSGSGTSGQTCNVSAKAAGSGSITVSANISGSTVATQAVPVNVSDSRALSWTNATTPIACAVTKTAVLNSNFSCTATITSDNSKFLIGTASNALSSSASVTFTNNNTQTIYYKYTGQEQATVKITAVDSKVNSISACLNVSVTAPAPPSPSDDYYIHVTEYTEGKKICICVNLSESLGNDILFVYNYAAFSGTPSHAAAESAGQSYVPFLQRFAVSSDNLGGTFTVPAGTTEFTFKTKEVDNIRHYKRNTVSIATGGPANRTVLTTYHTDYTYNSDNFLTTIGPGSGSGTPYTPKCLGTIKGYFSDYDFETNDFNNSNVNRLAIFNLDADGDVFSIISRAAITVELIEVTSKKVLETKVISLSKANSQIRFMNAGNYGNGFQYSDIGSTYFRVKDYSFKKSNGDYFILSL